ncbi:MAG: hypothetical protein II838_01320 [Lachnospiraceae bacterium]|nr:hypothetical protein [Lachnospiraceae bacterium]
MLLYRDNIIEKVGIVQCKCINSYLFYFCTAGYNSSADDIHKVPEEVNGYKL